MIIIPIGENEAGRRLDRFLRKYLEKAPLSFIYRAVRKDVKVNGARKPAEYVLQAGDQLALYLSDEELARLRRDRKRGRTHKTFRVIYEDENVLIVNKPAGLLTHGNGQERRDHLANQVVDYLIEEGAYDPRRQSSFSPAPVNRLDRNTSGLVLFALNYPVQRLLNERIRSRQGIGKYYRTICLGRVEAPLDLVSSMTKDETRNQVTEHAAGTEGARLMRTEVRPLAAGALDRMPVSLCQVQIDTGRTHQIRVQMAGAGHPLLGDPKYGDPAANRLAREELGLTVQLLHAETLRFRDLPTPLAYLNGRSFTAQPPVRFQAAEEALFGLSGGQTRR